jgi:purine-cytosine permease-like protein
MEAKKKESLSEEVDHILTESRMVLPGVQTLFGFQLIAVFNPGFREALPAAGRLLHLAALVMVAISIALIMAPAAYHRQAEPDSVSRTFARYASSLVTLAMAPLMLAIAIEVALVTFSIKPWLSLSAGLGAMVAVIYLLLWYVLPRIRRPHTRRR